MQHSIEKTNTSSTNWDQWICMFCYNSNVKPFWFDGISNGLEHVVKNQFRVEEHDTRNIKLESARDVDPDFGEL